MPKTIVLKDASCAGCGKVIKKGGKAIRVSWKSPLMAASHFAYYHPSCYKKFKRRR